MSETAMQELAAVAAVAEVVRTEAAELPEHSLVRKLLDRVADEFDDLAERLDYEGATAKVAA